MRTDIERARKRVDREREVVKEKRAAYGRFRARIGSISPRSGSTGTGGETLVSTASAPAAASAPIREAFAETVAPTCEDRPVEELLAAELGEEVATALYSGGLSPHCTARWGPNPIAAEPNSPRWSARWRPRPTQSTARAMRSTRSPSG